MMFWLDIGGYQIAVQAVNRSGKAYWRLAPYTIVYPTPKQREVRLNLSIAAHESANQPVEKLNENVQKQFINWEYAQRGENSTAQALREIYGDEADEVLEYIDHRKHARQALENREYKKQIEEKIQSLLIA